MATEYGGAYGDQAWRAAQPPYLGQPPYPDHDHDHDHDHEQGPSLPPGGGAHSRRSARRHRGGARPGIGVAVLILILGLVGLAASLTGVAIQVLPRHFTASQQRQIANWEYGKHWRELPAGRIFPASVRYAPPASLEDDPALGLTARRIGIARQASCRSATDAAAAAVLDRDGCAALLRATYVDGTGSYVVTVGAAAMPSVALARAAARGLASAPRAGRIAPGVHTVRFGNTPAAGFTDPRRQFSGAITAGTYVVLYVVGFADKRPWEPVSGDGYTDGEMTRLATGVARTVLSALAAPVPPARCPGTPGC